MTVVLIFALGLGFAYSAQAGLFGLNVFAAEDSLNGQESILNSQNLPILQVSSSPLLALNDDKSKEAEVKLDGAALLPENGPSGTIADLSNGGSDYSNEQISLYSVRKNDTISSIAKMFNVSINTIRWANDLSPNQKLSVGQVLIILPVNGVQYTVKKGDTLGSIAKKLKADADDIKDFNNLADDSKLAIGDVIMVPGGEILSSSNTGGNSSGATATRGSKLPNYAEYFIRPIVGGHRTQGLHGRLARNGVDLGAPYGTPVMVAAPGTVITSKNSGWNGGLGRYIAVQHPNGTQTFYGHLSRAAVNSGQTVDRGEVIGYVGSSGRSTGSHLHFEVIGAQNPLGYNPSYGL